MAENNISKGNPYLISQNFMTAQRLLERITALSSISKKDLVLEIGTGKGHLSCVLARKCKTLYTTEIDARLYRQAQRRLAPYPNVRLTHGDLLRSPLPEGMPYKVFANLPFSITSQILRKLSNAGNPPSEMWLVMEKGAAKRFLGKPRESKQSLLLKPRWDMRVVYHFRREDFHPCPSADAVLVHFSQKAQADIPPAQWPRYTRFVAHVLRYGLHGGEKLLTQRQISQVLKRAGLPPDYENGMMLYVQWLCLFRCWVNLRKSLSG